MENKRYPDIGSLIGVPKYVILGAGLACKAIWDVSKRVVSILNMDGAFNVANAGGIQEIEFAYMRMVNDR